MKNKEEPLVTIVITTFNRVALLEKANGFYIHILNDDWLDNDFIEKCYNVTKAEQGLLKNGYQNIQNVIKFIRNYLLIKC